MGAGRPSTLARRLGPSERDLARAVFETKLPPWATIGVLNGLGLGDRPWTDNTPVYQSGMWHSFQMMLGPLADLDLTSMALADRWLGAGFGRICDIFVHEMTHVWQYYRGQWVKTRSGAAQVGERVLKYVYNVDYDSYAYTAGAAWNDYNPEQQAHIVEDWNHRGRKDTDALFPYIKRVIREDAGRYGDWDLNELFVLDAGDFPSTPDTPHMVRQHEPAPPEATDQYLIEILQPRYAANDEARAVARVKELADIFGLMRPPRARTVLKRLETRGAADLVSKLFWDRFAPASQARLLAVLRKRAAE